MAVRHETNDNYMLQVKRNGNWHDVHKVRKSGGANVCRVATRNSGNVHRIINLSKGGAVYCEAEPR